MGQKLSFKKICLVGHEYGYFPGHGGIATYLSHLVRGLLEVPNVELLLIFQVGDGPELQNERVKWYKIAEHSNPLLAALEVEQILIKEQPEVIEVTDFLGLCNQFLLSRVLQELPYNPVIVTNHHTSSKEIWEWGTGLHFFPTANRTLKNLSVLERTQFDFANMNISTSNFLTNYIKDTYGLQGVACIPAYHSSFNQTELYCSSDTRSEIRILSIGRFELRKRQDLLIGAVTLLHERGVKFKLTLVGNSTKHFYTGDDYREICFAQIPAALRDCVNFYDFMGSSQAGWLYRDHDVFVVPSSFENFPNTAIDALTNSLPVIGSSKSGIVDMVGENSLEMIFESGSIESLADALFSFASKSKEARARVLASQITSLKKLVNYESAIEPRLQMFEQIYVKSRTQISKNIDIGVEIIISNGDSGGNSLTELPHGKPGSLVPDEYKGRKFWILYYSSFDLSSDFLKKLSEINLHRFPSQRILGFTSQPNNLYDLWDISHVMRSWPMIMQISVPGDANVSWANLVAEAISNAKDISYRYEKSAIEDSLDDKLKFEIQKKLYSKG